ncbi:ImuA family protein [Marivita sp.]|jgi:protein ImuA|uniref:ImuA family protein n=1 Tax=Marivita sp. TaxID=2003365 RepID=UPI003F6CCB18
MHNAATLLSRRPHRPAPQITLGDPEIALRLGRVHELCGQARHMLAVSIVTQLGGPVVWITQQAATEYLCPEAIADQITPGHILFVTPSNKDMILWAMEDALRDGHAPVVVADLTAPPAMVPIRRLHLAAEAGCGIGACRPLALLLTPGQGGAPGIETRWSLEPAHHNGAGHWTLSRLRARMAPPRDWLMIRGQTGLMPAAPEPEISYEISAQQRNFVRNSLGHTRETTP